jgi:hypothetical protein
MMYLRSNSGVGSTNVERNTFCGSDIYIKHVSLINPDKSALAVVYIDKDMMKRCKGHLRVAKCVILYQ